MITICMSYYNRKPQLKITLESITKSQFASEVFIVLVDDASDKEHRLLDEDIPFPHKLVVINKEEKTWCNPCIANNIALRNIPEETDVILLQNPENIHVGDIIEVCTGIKDNEYHIFACYCLQYNSSLDTPPIDRGGVSNNLEGWICHTKYNNNIYNYAVALTPTTLKTIGYFDEKFAHGICRDDDEFSDRVYASGTHIIRHNSPYVKHQFHPCMFTENFYELFKMNDDILKSIRRA
ncbi:MAG TPA: glycosyltransferase [Bacteroidales bacterium]|nr:glycosyltransferase [Bacteroidales bacterium]